MSIVPRAVLKVAFQKGRRDSTTSGDFTDLSSRIKRVSCRRGRSDARGDFSPGTLTVELDNDDRMLDPSNSSAYNYTAGNKGLPGCPVTLDLEWGGNTYRRFTGYLGPDNWRHGIGRKLERTITLEAVDLLAYPPGLPRSLWGLMVHQLGQNDPDTSWWYLSMDHGFPILNDGTSELENQSGTGGSAPFYSPASGGTLLGRIEGTSNPVTPIELRMPEESYVVSEAADVMPGGDELNLTAFVLWRPDRTALTGGETSKVMWMRYPGGGNTRWLIQVEDDGDAHIYTYDSGGSLVDSDTIAHVGARWDQVSTTQLVMARFTSGNTLKVWFGGYTTTLTATSTVYESDFIIGPSDRTDTWMSEAVVIRRSLTDAEMAGIVLASQYGRVWFGFSHADTIGAFFEAAHRRIGPDETDEWHVPAPDVNEYGYFGASASNGIPATLVEALRQVAGPFGAVWVTKEGDLRVRTIDALTSGGDFDAYYVDVSASFTDAVSLSGTDLRHAGASKLGAQLDRVVNACTITFPFMSTALDLSSTQVLAITSKDQTSIDRLDLQDETVSTLAWHGFARAMVVADTMVARYAWPEDEYEMVRLDATGDDDLTLWLARDCELELAVTVTHTPPGASAETSDVLNIQQESWSLDGEKFTAELVVAKS